MLPALSLTLYNAPMLHLRLAPILLLLPVLTFAQTPQRIVSMNVCTDQLLLLLVEHHRIASLSYLAADPAYSALADQAMGMHLNRGLAEEIITLDPDLIITGPFSASLAASLLARQGYKVSRLGLVDTIDAVFQQLMQMGMLTGTEDAATVIGDNLRRQLAASQARLRPVLQNKTAIFFSNNGVVYGSNTLQHSFLESLGMRNLAAEAGLSGPAQLALETVVANAPDFIFTSPVTLLDAQLAHPLLLHRVWQQIAGQSRKIVLPGKWFDCAGPELGRAYLALEEALL